METLELSKMGLVPVTTSEMQQIEGGTLPSWMKGLGIGWVADQIIKNWDEIKAGFTEGYKAQV
jgi:hypothetical protein